MVPGIFLPFSDQFLLRNVRAQLCPNLPTSLPNFWTAFLVRNSRFFSAYSHPRDLRPKLTTIPRRNFLAKSPSFPPSNFCQSFADFLFSIFSLFWVVIPGFCYLGVLSAQDHPDFINKKSSPCQASKRESLRTFGSIRSVRIRAGGSRLNLSARCHLSIR